MNRNQSYGAYLLRKAYPGRVNLSFAFAMITVSVLLAAPGIKSFFEDEVETTPLHHTVIDYTELQPPPRFDLPKPPVVRPEMKTARFVPPKVTEHETEDLTPSIVDLLTAPVTTDIPGDATITIIEDVEPVVPLPVAKDPNEIRTWVEIAPEFPGGTQEMMKFIAKHIKYPATARRMGTEGLVFISFVVDKDGTITDMTAIKGISDDCDSEAMRVIGKMPKWKPGRQGGEAVRVRFVLPIRFALGN